MKYFIDNYSITKDRINWLSVLRGLNIILVVMFHVELIDMVTGENHIFCDIICYPFNPIRMPLFIFCSGGLLYISRISKNWNIKQLYIDKVERILCPFLFFVTFYYFLKVLMNPFIKTKVVLSINNYLESFYIYPQHPSSHLWFLSVLFFFMLLYPLFKWLCGSKYKMTFFLLFSVVIYFFDFTQNSDENYFYFFTLNKYLVFFFFGIYFFKYEFYKYKFNYYFGIFTTTIYLLCLWKEIPLLSSLFGILMMIFISQNLSLYFPNLFSYFREYIYQIFLLSFIFQPFVELILWKKIFYNESLFYFFYVLNVLSGIYMPTLVSKCVEKSKIRWVNICFGLKIKKQ